MTREQSKKVQEVERIIDYLCDMVELMTTHGGYEPVTSCIDGSILLNDEYCKDVEALNTKVHDYELGLLNELKDKYLKIYAEL